MKDVKKQACFNFENKKNRLYCLKHKKDGICGNERPDFLFESPLKTHFVILEIDEDQHYGRPEECECTRMVNISQSLGLPTLFLRYNPDSYKTDKTKYDPAFSTRMKKLKFVLDKMINLNIKNITGFVMLRKLYFNGYKDSDVNYYNVLDFEK